MKSFFEETLPRILIIMSLLFIISTVLMMIILSVKVNKTFNKFDEVKQQCEELDREYNSLKEEIDILLEE